MARKRHAKPKSPPPAAQTPQNQETQIEALATFLDTGSPPHEPIQSIGSQATMQPSGSQDLPHSAYSLRREAARARTQELTDLLRNSTQYAEVSLRSLKDEQELLRKEVGTATTEIYDYFDKTRMLVSEVEQSKGFEKNSSQPCDSQVLQDLKEGIDALTGYISNVRQSRLRAKLQRITEHMKVTPMDTKVLLSHPDGSPNENAFEQEAAVQKMLLEISDLEANIKLWAGTVNKAKEPAKEAKEPAREMSGKRNMTDAERKQSAINRYMHKFNIDEATAKQRWLRVHHTRLLEAEIMAQTCDEVQEDTKVAIANIEPLRIRSGQSYESTSIPPMDTQNRELSVNANRSFLQARDATIDAISAPKPDMKSKFEAKIEKEQPAVQGLRTARGQKMMAAEAAPLSTAKASMYADVTHTEEIVNLWIAFWSNDRSVWGPLHEYVMQFPVSTRDDVWESHMDWLGGGIYEPVARTAKRVDKIASRLTEELVYSTPLDSNQLAEKLEALQGPNGENELTENELQRQETEGIWSMREAISTMRYELTKSREYDLNNGKESSKKPEEQPQKSNGQSLECKMQQQEIERLLKLREEHLHKREKQQVEFDGLLQKLDEQLQGRESRLAERESRVHNREVEWEKHQEQRQEIERLLQQRDSQLQKRDDQVQTREEQSLRREEQLLSRERAADARITLGNQQATKVQAEIEEGKDKLAALYNAHEKVMRSTEAQDIELSKRTDAVKNRESALLCREKCLEQVRMSLHEQLKGSMDVVAKPYTGWGGLTTAGWPGVLELAVQARMYVESRGSDWGQNEIQLADLKKIAAQVEEEAKKMIFGSGEIKVADVEKLAADTAVDDKKDAGVFTEEDNFFASKEWLGSEWKAPASTSTEDVKPAP